jgi:hypothetical protein
VKRLGLLVASALILFVPAAAGATPAFGPRIDNPWYPLLPGSVYVYRGEKDGKQSRDVLTVTHRTKVVDGARCLVVQDRLYLDGRLEERTTEWYSQDARGNVWYFGENTAELDPNGHVTTRSGSWTAGTSGAQPGIFMFATPRVGQSGSQELLKGQAEDRFRVVSVRTAVSVPYITSGAGVLTREWSPLEPGVLDHKVYVRGVGDVLEETVRGGSERASLVSYKRGS